MYQESQEFKKFVLDCKNSKYKSPLEVDPKIFRLEDWNFLSRTQAEEIFLPFIRYNIERSLKTMPDVYLKPYREAGISPESIESIEDFWRVPPIPKDSSAGYVGLREKVLQMGYGIVEPNDIEKKGGVASAYFSGGTMGISVPTFVTEFDLQVEAFASYRALIATGIKQGSVVINTYNTSHKGGEVIGRALKQLSGSHYIQVRSNDLIKHISEHITRSSRHERELLFVGTQPPIKEEDSQQKGSGRTLFDLIRNYAPIYQEYVDRILLGGFRIIPEVEHISKAEGPLSKPITTIFGSTEIMPAFFGTPFEAENPDKLCVFNNLHTMFGPHYIEVIKFDDRHKMWKPAKVGERGVLALTSVFREGTLYNRYLIGDSARILREEKECECSKTLNEILTDITRIGKEGEEELILTGCAAL